MNSTLYYLSGFNNYYNRQVKRVKDPGTPVSMYNKVQSYESWVVLTAPGTGFNPNDGVQTVATVNYNQVPDEVEFDYLVVSEDNINIDSRWFVLERKRNLIGQYEVKLYRDLFVDYYESIINSPVYIEKAEVGMYNKLIFNSENGTYNQIKTKEYLLKDKSKCPWIVGYISAKDFKEDIITLPADLDSVFPECTYTYEDLMKLDGKTTLAFSVPRSAVSVWGLGPEWTGSYRKTMHNVKFNLESGAFMSDVEQEKGDGNAQIYINTEMNVDNVDAFIKAFESKVSAYLPDIQRTAAEYSQQTVTLSNKHFITVDQLKDVKALAGQVYKDPESATLFKIKVNSTGTHSTKVNLTTSAGALEHNLSLAASQAGCTVSYNQSDVTHQGLWLYSEFDTANITIETISVDSVSVRIPKTANTLIDAPYKMFCIPYGTIRALFPYGTQDGAAADTSAILAQRLATELPIKLSSQLYDIQLLPYCPLQTLLNGQNIDLSELKEDVDFSIVKHETPQGDASNVGVIIWPKQSSFDVKIDYYEGPPSTALSMKVENETRFVRLCSPNYSGSFEFKPSMNYGINGFEANCTYKPYQPYIHINPVFNPMGLYGRDFNDQRGLVCTGDFSLPVANDAWEQYQVNNKSYADSFKRQIENMNVNYDIQRDQAVTAGITGAVGSAFSLGASGGIAGGTFGKAAGAAAGGASGLIGGIASLWGLSQDLENMERSHKEALSYATDQYNYQLQNVQALPYTLGKVSAFSINNKIFPFLEFYDASEEEKLALANKLKYSGFTVGIIDTIKPYLKDTETFVQGKLVRYLPFYDSHVIDYHASIAIANELHKGVYI